MHPASTSRAQVTEQQCALCHRCSILHGLEKRPGSGSASLLLPDIPEAWLLPAPAQLLNTGSPGPMLQSCSLLLQVFFFKARESQLEKRQ